MGLGLGAQAGVRPESRGFGGVALFGVSRVFFGFLRPELSLGAGAYANSTDVLTLFRGGPAMWLSVEDAEKIGVADNDWLEVYNRHGTVACRAAVSHRVPPGVALYYHSQDRHVNVPVSEISGARGGTDNSLTRISIKPSHLIGGYAQLSWGFNYYGPTGPQRDQLIIVRKRRTEAVFG